MLTTAFLLASKKQNKALHVMRHWEARTRHTPTYRHTCTHTERENCRPVPTYCQSLDSLLGRLQGDQSHPPVLPTDGEIYTYIVHVCMYAHSCMLQTYGKNLKSVTCIPRDVKISLSFSSSMSTLHVQHTYITVITEFMSCTLLHSAVNRCR